MFYLFRKIIDDKTLRHYCAVLTGVMPTSKPYGRDKQIRSENLLYDSDPLLQIGSPPLKTMNYELVFDYDGKAPDEEELIHLEFREYKDKDLNLVTFHFRRISDGNEIAFQLKDPAYDIFDRSKKVSSMDVEISIEVAKWMIAVGMSNGRVAANDIVRRKQLNPRYWMDFV